MNEKNLSLIRHILTGLGVVLGFVGLNKYVPVIDFLQTNLEVVNSAVVTLVGFALTLFGFFKSRPAEWGK